MNSPRHLMQAMQMVYENMPGVKFYNNKRNTYKAKKI